MALRGREQIFDGERGGGSAGLTHFRRSRSRVRVLLYIRPPCPRREIKAMGSKRRSRECSSPAKTSAPAPSAFIFRARVHTSPAYPSATPTKTSASAAAVIHNGLSTEKLSTLLLAALCKTFSPSRLRTRIYNISFARRPLPGVSAPLWGRVRAVVAPWSAPPSAGWGRAKAKAAAPSRSNPHFPCLRPNHCAQGGGGRRQRWTPPRTVSRPCPPTAMHFAR